MSDLVRDANVGTGSEAPIWVRQEAWTSTSPDAGLSGSPVLIGTLILTLVLAGYESLNPIMKPYKQPDGASVTYTDYRTCVTHAEEASGYPFALVSTSDMFVGAVDPVSILV